MTQKTAKDAMTPISEIFSLDINTRLDEYAFASVTMSYYINFYLIFGYDLSLS